MPCEVDDDDDGDDERLSGSRCLLSLYLLGQALRVLQAVREGLDQEVAAALTQSAVVLALLAGVGEESQPHLRHRVAAGLLSEHVRGGSRSDRVKLNVGCWLFWGFFFLPLESRGEPLGQFIQRSGVLALDLTPPPQVVAQVLQLLALLLQRHVQHLQLLSKLAADLWKEPSDM